MDDPEIQQGEDLATFVLESNKFKKGVIHARALMPGGPDGNRSVFRTSGLTRHEIAALGVENVAARREKPLLGWGTVVARDVRVLGLHVRRDEPPRLHAVIENWPPAIEDQRVLALVLATKASSVVL